MTEYIPSEKLAPSRSDDSFGEFDTKEQIARPHSLPLQITTLLRMLGLAFLLGICWYAVRGKASHYLSKCKGVYSSDRHIQTGFKDVESQIESDDRWLQGREYRRHETTASIRGTFPLYNLLELTTRTGEIDVTVVPKPGKGAAVIFLHTNTGRINVKIDPSFLSSVNVSEYDDPTYDDTTLKSILSRPFEVIIGSEMGSIEGEILVGNGRTTEVSSETGSISLDIFPVGVGKKDKSTMLHTTTKVGSQDIRIKSPLHPSRKEQKITNLRTRHEAQTGSVKAVFPELWRGQVKITAATGSIQATGKDLEIDLEENRRVEAHRGHGELVEIEVLTGSATFRNGDLLNNEKQ